jgi:hypothetical protein
MHADKAANQKPKDFSLFNPDSEVGFSPNIPSPLRERVRVRGK